MLRKNLKNFSSMLVVTFALAAVFFSGCSKEQSVSTSDKNGFTIGYLNWGQGIPVLDSFQHVAQNANDAIGNKMIVVSDKFTAEQQLSNIQNMIASHVDGIMFDAIPTTLIPDIAEKCKEAKIPFIMYNHTPTLVMHKKLTENPYYVGSIGLKGVETAKAMAKVAIADKNKTVIFIGGAVGDPTHDERIKAFTEEFTARGGKVLGAARCADPSESPAKSEDLLSTYPKADCLYAVTGDFVPGPVNSKHNLKITHLKIYGSCVDKATLDYIDKGEVLASDEGTSLPGIFGYIMLENYLEGHRFIDESGKAPFLTSPFFPVSKSNAKDVRRVFIDSQPIPNKMIKNLVYKFNNKIDYTAFSKFLTNLSLDSLSKANK
jgi:ribose transport system substrate-binding protein